MTKKQLVAIAAVAATLAGALLGAGSAQAYPAGKTMTVSLDVHDNVNAGSTISARAYNVYPGCKVNFKFSATGSNAALSGVVSGMADSKGTTGLVKLKAPSIASNYKVTASAVACASMTGRTYANDSIQIGRVGGGSLSLTSTSRSVAKRPTFTVNGTLTWGLNQVANRSGWIKIANSDGTVIASEPVTSSSKGKFSFSIKPSGLKAGTYTAVAIFGANKVYQSFRATSLLTLTK